MKNIFYLLVLSLIFISCETEDMSEHIEARDTTGTLAKRGSNVPAVLSFQEHQDMLAWNSFIVGEVMRLSPTDRTYVLNSFDPATKTVSMTSLLSQNLFYEHYVHIATYASYPFYDRCGNPDNSVWPPKDPKDPFRRDTAMTTPTRVQNLLNNLQSNKTEIFIPTTVYSGNIFSVGHPLVDQIGHVGSLIYFTTIEYNFGVVLCQRHSESMHVGPANQTNNDFIILSRPNLETGNPYSYINFDIHNYLRDLGNNNSGGPFLGGRL
jgi:hypothetical protein